MKPILAVSAIGKDRPGIVARLTGVLLEFGGNLEECSMTRLKGDFAVLLLVALPEDADAVPACAALEKEAEALGLSLLVRRLGEDEKGRDVSDTGRSYHLVFSGADKPGLVHRMAETALQHGLNITDLRNRLVGNGPRPVYSLELELDVPSAQSADRFREALEKIEEEFEVPLAFAPSDRSGRR
jgi:glycine cleavage system transcriptional repressor